VTKKWCNGCARFLVPSEFWRNSFMPDGLQQWCKSCIRAWRYANREIEREHDRARVLKKTRLRVLERTRARTEKNPR
jgi:RNase P subunit RPR2